MRAPKAFGMTVGTAILIGLLLCNTAAAADILEIDCDSGVPGTGPIHIWIDMQSSFVTMQQSVPPGMIAYHGSYRVQITPTSFDWAMAYPDGTMTASVDRTTGQLHLIDYGGNNMNVLYPCTKGSTPFPTIKF